jgi:hypothetical protein
MKIPMKKILMATKTNKNNQLKQKQNEYKKCVSTENVCQDAEFVVEVSCVSTTD